MRLGEFSITNGKKLQNKDWDAEISIKPTNAVNVNIINLVGTHANLQRVIECEMIVFQFITGVLRPPTRETARVESLSSSSSSSSFIFHNKIEETKTRLQRGPTQPRETSGRELPAHRRARTENTTNVESCY